MGQDRLDLCCEIANFPMVLVSFSFKPTFSKSLHLYMPSLLTSPKQYHGKTAPFPATFFSADRKRFNGVSPGSGACSQTIEFYPTISAEYIQPTIPHQ